MSSAPGVSATFKCRLLSLSFCCPGCSCLHVSVVLAWQLHHFPSLKSLDCSLSLNYLANWYQESSQVWWYVCHAWFGFCTLSLGYGALSLCLLFSYLLFCCFFTWRTLSIPAPHYSTTWMGVFGSHWVFWGCPLLAPSEACAARLCLHTFSMNLNA